MKNIHIIAISRSLDHLRNMYHQFLKKDNTFHFVLWSNVKWKGIKLENNHVFLRVNEAFVDDVKKYLIGVATYQIDDYPYSKKRFNFSLTKKSVESRYNDEFHKIYHLYSVLSILSKNEKEREKILFQLLHIPLNVFGKSFIEEAKLYTRLLYNKIDILENIKT